MSKHDHDYAESLRLHANNVTHFAPHRLIEAADHIEDLTRNLGAANKRVEELEKRLMIEVVPPDNMHIITDAQIDAAWACVEENRESGNEDLMQIGDAEERMLHNCFGIVRCEECGGSGKWGEWADNGKTYREFPCPTCNGHRWVVKEE